jgi:hypothetical protein
MPQDLPSLVGQAEDTVKKKHPDWTLVSKRQERPNEIVCQWGTLNDGMRLLIFYGDSEQEAVERMNLAIKFIPVGPDKKLAGLGHEAYLWKTYGRNLGIIRFGKSNVFIDLTAPSVAVAEDMARSLAGLITSK